MSDEQVNVPSESAADAVVNAPYEMTMFDASGRSVVIASEDKEYWLGRGFRVNKLDVEADSSALYAAFDAAKGAVKAYIDGCVKDGYIDPSDEAALATATVAMGKLTEMYIQIMADCAQLYPMRQGDPVQMTHSDGTTISIDPNQVDLYTEQGFTRG